LSRKWKDWNVPKSEKEDKKDRPARCESCGWVGNESDLIEVKDMGKGFKLITKERGCPNCRSLVIRFQ
jgi:predicted Zn-ribbon and HTH transcriptional regulator